MAIFLSRIKKILNLGTKSITQNGTYDASDDGYEGYSQVTVNVSATGTSITPSNASPVALTANTAVKPTTAGYAIESYSDVTPSNVSPVSLTSGDIVKLGGNGKAVASITSITPSNSPNLIGLGGIYAPTREGYVVQSVENVTPSDSSPANLLSGGIYKTNNAGVAIYSYQSYGAPSNSGTPFNAGFTKWTAGGYAYPSRPEAAPDFSNPDLEWHSSSADLRSSATTIHITTTAKPRYIILAHGFNNSSYIPNMRTTVVDVEKGKCSLIQWYNGWASDYKEREMDILFGVTNVTSTGFDIVKATTTTSAYNVKYLGALVWY